MKGLHKNSLLSTENPHQWMEDDKREREEEHRLWKLVKSMVEEYYDRHITLDHAQKKVMDWIDRHEPRI